MRRFLSLLLLGFLFLPQALSAKEGQLRSNAVRLPPLFWYEHDPANQQTFLMALLLYWQGKDPSGSFNLLAPLYYSSVAKDESLRVLLPVHFKYRLRDSQSTLWGPYFEKRTPGFRTRYVVPLFWDHKPADPQQKTTQLLFPFYLKTSDERQRSVYSPFFWVYKDTSVSQGLIPPYFWNVKADSAFEVGFPLYWRFFKKEGSDLKDIQVAVPWFRIRSETSSLRSFFPVYWGRTSVVKDEEGKESTGTARTNQWDIFFPLLYHSKKPDGTERTVSPLYSRIQGPTGKVYGHGLLNFYSRDPRGARTDGFFPIALYREDPAFWSIRFLLFYYYTDAKDEHFNASVFPVFKYKRDGDRRQILTPPAYWDRDPEMNRGYVANFFWRKDSDGNKKLVFFPLVWHLSSHLSKTTVFPPLVAFHKEENYSLAMVAPFYFRRQRGDDILKVIPPVVSRISPDRTWRGLFFLYWNTKKPDRSAVTLLPLFRLSRFPGGRSIFVPGFYHLREGSQTQGVAGIYLWDYRGKTQYNILFPLYWDFRRPTWSVKTLFPFYEYRGEEIRERGFFPIIANTKPVRTFSDTPKHFLADSHRFLPFYFYRRLEHGYDLWLPVVLGRFERGLNSKKEETVRGRLFLLGFWERTPSSFMSRFDPLYTYYRNADSIGFMAPTAPLPLWRYEVANRNDPEKRISQGAFFPYYWKESRTFRSKMVIPVFYKSRHFSEDGKEEKSRKTWLLLYYASQNKEKNKSMALLIPLYFHFQNKDHTTTILPPLWMEKSEQVSRNIFFPLFFSSEDKAAQRKTLLFPGFWRSKDPDSEVRLAGIFFRKEDFKRKETVSVTFPLYWNLKSPARSLSYFFPLYFSHKRENHDAKVLFPIFWKFSTAESQVRVVPPYFSVLSKTSKTKTTGLAPLWTTIRSTENQAMNFQLLGGIFGYERDAAGKSEITFLYVIKL